MTGLIKALFTLTDPELGLAEGLSAGQYKANCLKIGPLKIQWGTISTNVQVHHTITFKKPFTSIGYAAFASYTSQNAQNVDDSKAAITDQHTDYCKIYTNGGPYAWLCIGY